MNYIVSNISSTLQRMGKRRIAGWSFVLLAVASVGLVFGLDVAAWSLLPLLIGATQVGDITETSTPDSHQVRDVSMTLSTLRPDIFTLDTILRRMEASNNGMPTEPATNIKVEWEEDDTIEYATTVDGATSAGSSGASVTFSVNDANVVKQKDVLYLPDNATTKGTTLWVTNVNGTAVTAYRVEMDTSETSFGTVPALADGEAVKVLTRAKTEQDNASDAQGTMPAGLYNYTQIIDQVVAASETRLATENYTENDWNRNRNQNLWEFRRKLENAATFGERMKITDPVSGKQTTMMGGIVTFLSSNDLTYTTGSLTESNLIDFMKQIFSGNNGSSLRWAFTTPNLTAELDKILIASGTLQSTRDENVLGVEATRVHSSFGDLMLINNQNFEELGKSNYGLVIDPMNVRRRTLRDMRIKRNVQDNDVDGRADQWIEEATVEVRKESTHAVIRDTATDSFE